MSHYTLKRLERLTDDQLKYICKLNEKAFADDPSTEIMMGGDLSLSFDYWSAVLRATVLEGELWVATVGQGKQQEITSWAGWFAPGTTLFGTEEQRSLGFYDFLKKCSAEMQDWPENTYPLYIQKLVNEIFSPEEMKSGWWCHGLATHPIHQRKGFATALMDIGFQKATRARESGSFAGVMTSNPGNVLIYETLGFKMVGDVIVPSPKGRVHVFVFTKRPQLR